jgi:hypothetical protein
MASLRWLSVCSCAAVMVAAGLGPTGGSLDHWIDGFAADLLHRYASGLLHMLWLCSDAWTDVQAGLLQGVQLPFAHTVCTAVWAVFMCSCADIQLGCCTGVPRCCAAASLHICAAMLRFNANQLLGLSRPAIAVCDATGHLRQRGVRLQFPFCQQMSGSSYLCLICARLLETGYFAVDFP